jgi:hypothetical protein
MWPFRKKVKVETQTMPANQISFSQLDITERFDDNARLGAEDWISTVPLNTRTRDAQAMGLPSLN